MPRSQLPVLAVAVALGGLVALLFLTRRPEVASVEAAPPPPASVVVPPPVSEPIPAMEETPADTPQDPVAAMENAGVGARSPDPAELLTRIGDLLEAGDLPAAARLIGDSALTPEARSQLAALASQGALKLRRPDAASEVGEIELNSRTRWALHLDGAEPGRDRIFFDLVRDGKKWAIESIDLPPSPGLPVPKARLVDSLGIADSFLQATLHQNFERAKEFVDPASVSDAKIAGLCILFEEGGYRLRPVKPLRAMFQRGDTAGYLAHVVAADGTEAAQFSLTMRRQEPGGNWRLFEINLDQLLADYARRVAGGDVYYTPLLKNPQGGDTLVLYFDFDHDGLTERTARQLDIVAEILKTDPDRKLNISGHTDALGTEEYNRALSSRRAASVMEHLVKSGVSERQIVTHAEGQSQPRRPNFTEAGDDNPDGRRVNRRSEIYLDF